MIPIHFLNKQIFHVFPNISVQLSQNIRISVAKVSSSLRKSRREILTHGIAALAAILYSGDGFCFHGVFAAEPPVSELQGLNFPINSDGILNLRFKEKESSIAGEQNMLSNTWDARKTWSLMPLTSQFHGSTPHKGSGRNSRASSKGDNIQRFFDTNAKTICWDKAEMVSGRHPDRWRKDIAGNIVFKRFHNCQGCLCFQYDHIIPYSRGGLSVAENCQILQTRVNRLKSDKENVNANQLKGYSCDIHFNELQMDTIEISYYGNILRPGNECRVKSIEENRGKRKSESMAVCKLP